MDYWQYLIFVIVVGCQHVRTLFVTNIEVPDVVDFRDRIKLSCSYNMGNHKLNSVKWYKDGMEFFRYSPMTHPVFMTFEVYGVIIANEKYYCNEVRCSVELDQLNSKSSGAYRCEVSGDAPEFKLTSRTANMTVAALPQHDPLINGVNPTYRIDDFVVANCSSDWSSPPATLSWYINDEKAPPHILQPEQETTITANDFNLRLRSLEIRFNIDRQHFINPQGVLRLKCIADINRIPSMRREKIANAFILGEDDLNNQKLVNWKNSADRRTSSSFTLTLDGIIFIVAMRFLRFNILKNIAR